MERGSYHHGDLRRALIDATADLIQADGPSGFSLRKVARVAGVSPAAPSHHFDGSRGLLTAVATEGFERLFASFSSVDPAASPSDQLRELGRRYVGLAIDAPGHMAIMFRGDLIDREDAAYRSVAPQTYAVLESAVAAALDEPVGSEHVEHATRTHWAAMHGIADLYAGSVPSLDDDPELSRLVDAAVETITIGMIARRDAS